MIISTLKSEGQSELLENMGRLIILLLCFFPFFFFDNPKNNNHLRGAASGRIS